MSEIKNYSLSVKSNSPKATLRIPNKILRDIVLRSQENGTSVELEISMRLARSLERDYAMEEEDSCLALKAFYNIH